MEARPADADVSTLQRRVDAAPSGATVVVEAGDYEGDLVLDRPITLVGRGRPRLLGSGHGSVVRVRGAGVTIESFDVDGRGEGDLGRDSSGIHVSAPHATLRDCTIDHASPAGGAGVQSRRRRATCRTLRTFGCRLNHAGL